MAFNISPGVYVRETDISFWRLTSNYEHMFDSHVVCYLTHQAIQAKNVVDFAWDKEINSYAAIV